LSIDETRSQRNKLENLNCQNHQDAEDVDKNQVNDSLL